MEVLRNGHAYQLATLDGDEDVRLDFVDRGHGHDYPGTTNQEVLRVLIDRVKFLNNEIPWEGNEKIIQHLRAALVLHEGRHLERLIEKGELEAEFVELGDDGHFKLS